MKDESPKFSFQFRFDAHGAEALRVFALIARMFAVAVALGGLGAAAVALLKLLAA